MNLGTSKGTTVLELIRVFEKVNNVKIPIAYEKRRNGDVSELVADISLAKSLINFFPSRSIQDMCKDGWKWYLNNPEGYENN